MLVKVPQKPKGATFLEVAPFILFLIQNIPVLDKLC